MNVLVVGGTSALGRALVPALSSIGRVTTAGRGQCDVRMDLLEDAGQIVVPPGTEAVVHTAAHFGGAAPDDHLKAAETNVLGTLKLCIAADRVGVRHFVFISSQSAALDERSPYFGVYALSKRQGEEAARLYCSGRSMALTILRPSQIYGRGDSFRPHQPFLYAIMDKARAGQDVVLSGSRDALRNFLHVDDLSAVIGDVLRKGLAGCYACMHPHDVPFSMVAEAAYAAWGTRGQVRYRPEQADTPDNVFPADNSLFERLGWYPSLDIREGLQRLARDLRCAP